MQTQTILTSIATDIGQSTSNEIYKFIVVVQIAVIILFLFAFIIVFYRAILLRRKINEIEKLRATDLAETNDLLIEKSENELKLFIQFENVLEELVKMMRKNDIQVTKIIEEQSQQRIILEYHLKK